MTTFTSFVNTITNKKTNNIPLDEGETIITNIYKDYILDFILSKQSEETIIIKDIMEMVRINLIKNKKYIIKLNFSNGTYLYVSLDTLNNIEYFRGMFENYNFGDNCIVDVNVSKEIDNYDYMNIILKFVNTKKYDNGNMTYEEYHKMLIMVDYIGPIINKKNLIKYISKNTITKYENVYVNDIEQIYTILNNNKIKTKNLIFELWNNVLDSDNNNIYKTTFFCDIMIKQPYYRQLVIDNKQIHIYPKVINDVNCVDIMRYLLECNNDISWKAIMDIMNNKSNKKYVDKYFTNNKDEITEKIFEYDILKFSVEIQVYMMVKYNKIEYINDIGDNVVIGSSKSTKPYKDFCEYLNTVAPNSGNEFKKLSNVSPIKHYISTSKCFPKMTSYYPLEYRMWDNICDVDKLYMEDGIIKGIITKIKSGKNQIIKHQTQLLINNNDGEAYNIAIVEKILHPYYDGNNIKHIEIMEICCNTKTNEYCIILDEESLKRIKVNDDIHI